jgi:lipopolysaccharide/colanic/teichoic acid biosynthesis glycosyltransferase
VKSTSTSIYFLITFCVLTCLGVFKFISPIHSSVEIYFETVILIVHAILSFYIFSFLRCVEIESKPYLPIAYRLLFANIIMYVILILIAYITNILIIFDSVKLIQIYLYSYLIQLLVVLTIKLIFTKYYLNLPRVKNLFISNTTKAELLEILTSYDIEISDEIYSSQDLTNAIKNCFDKDITSVYIFLTPNDLGMLSNIIQHINQYAFEIFWIMPESILNYPNQASRQIIKLNQAPIYLDTSQYIIKRSMDILISSLFIVIFSPIFVFICALIYIFDGRPLIYSKDRYGQYGKKFKMYKFRTLLIDSDLNYSPVENNDLRITKLGKILRKLSLDELPQFFNVFIGDMSIVGPRPHILEDTTYFSKELPIFLTRHHVKPGITGLAQIKRRGKTITKDDMSLKIEKDLAYITNWSLILDLKIILLTPWSIIKNWKSNT